MLANYSGWKWLVNAANQMTAHNGWWFQFLCALGFCWTHRSDGGRNFTRLSVSFKGFTGFSAAAIFVGSSGRLSHVRAGLGLPFANAGDVSPPSHEDVGILVGVSPMSLQGCYTYPYFHATNKWHAHTIELHTTPMVFPCFSWVRTDLKSASFFVLCVCSEDIMYSLTR
jgi:hypothetical protein